MKTKYWNQQKRLKQTLASFKPYSEKSCPDNLVRQSIGIKKKFNAKSGLNGEKIGTDRQFTTYFVEN